MSAWELFFLFAAATGWIVSLVMALYVRKIHRDVEGLSRQINTFIQDGQQLGFSTSDEPFSMLHNSVCDLESLLLLEKDNTSRALRENTEFISDISHQLKTPLAALRLYVEIDSGDGQKSHSEAELQLIDKMESLVFRLLRLEKIRSDAYTMHFEQTLLHQLSEEVLGEFSTIYPHKKMTVTGKSELRVDRAWLSEALSNIVKNACEHTEENGIITVSLTDSERAVFISVEDNGGGVPEKELPKLFDRFHRAANARPDSAGIGLAIARAVVQKHHGTISAENTAKGLKIVICLPKIDGHESI